MINFDLSKALHPRFWDLLPAFMPGLFFEICVFLAEPDWVYRTLGHAQLERYLEIMIALILAFILGNGFMFWVMMLRTAWERLYLWAGSAWARLLKYLVSSKGNPPKRPRLGKFKWVDDAYIRSTANPGAKGASEAWSTAASKLLERRYGIDPLEIHSPQEWEAWRSALGTPKVEDIRGSLLVVTSHATGWSGVAAAYFAPALRNRYFLVFCGFLIFVGLYHTMTVISRWDSVTGRWFIALRAVLAEIPLTQTDEAKKGSAPFSGT